MNRKIYMIGLPSSGKTTFLAALGYSLLNEQISELYLEDTGDTEYLQKISSQWHKCMEMEHTQTNVREEMHFRFRDASGETYEVILPDQAGEYFKKGFRSDIEEEKFRNKIRNSDKLLFFVNPCKIEQNVLVGDMKDILEQRNIEYPKELETEHSALTGKDEQGEAQFHIGAAAEHVELLQSMLAAVPGQKKLEVTIIVSAWDIYADRNLKPEDAIREDIPLFWQVLKAQEERLEIVYWGLSAQGGRWDEKNRADIKKVNWKKRAFAVDSNGKRISHMIQIFM